MTETILASTFGMTDIVGEYDSTQESNAVFKSSVAFRVNSDKNQSERRGGYRDFIKTSMSKLASLGISIALPIRILEDDRVSC